MSQPKPRKCSRNTAAGNPCRAYALHDSDPPICSAHAGRNVGAGAPAGNKNAQLHGFYARHFTDQEQADLIQLADLARLDEEIGLTRVANRRLFLYMHDDDLQLHPDVYAHLARVLYTGANTTARLIRTRALLDDSGDTAIARSIAAALDHLGDEWNRQL